jgi:hypothetical protein
LQAPDGETKMKMKIESAVSKQPTTASEWNKMTQHLLTLNAKVSTAKQASAQCKKED